MTNIRDRISKLLNMTVANGCTEDEAETALRMAAAAAARAGIDLDSIRPKDAPKIKASAKRMAQELKPHQALCAEAAAVLYGVEANVYGLGKYGLTFVGRESNIELAEETMFWLFRQVEELYKLGLPRGLSKTARAEFRKTFKAGCAMRVRDRAFDLVLRMQRDQTAAQATGHNALVVKGYFDQLQTEVEDYWEERMRPHREAAEARLAAMTPEERAAHEAAAQKATLKHKPRKSRSIPVGSGTHAGMMAGDSVKLRKEVQ